MVYHVGQETIAYVNARAVTTLGGTSTEPFLGRPIGDFVQSDFGQTLGAHLEALPDQGYAMPAVEMPCLRLDGQPIHIEIMGLQVLPESRTTVQVWFHDITERKRIEEALQESEACFRLLMEQSPFGIQLFAPDGTLREANAAWEATWNARAEEVVGRYNALQDPQIRALGLADLMERAFAGEEIAFQAFMYDPSRSNRPGRERWIRAWCYPIRNSAGGLRHIVLITEDVTEHKQLQKAQEHLIAELETKNSELERFTYTVSHDLKSPLFTIGGFLGLLEQDLLAGNTAQARQDIRKMANAIEKMQDLLDNLLALSRAGRLMNTPKAIDLTDLTRQAVELVAWQIAERSVQVEIAPAMPTIQGDWIRLLEVFQNLLDNAVKFIGDQPEPRIEIGAETRGAEAVCFIRDNGIGIDPNDQQTVFGLFKRLDSPADGTGIGLNLVKGIVEAHGGRIWVESSGVGRGSTIYFTLPLA